MRPQMCRALTTTIGITQRATGSVFAYSAFNLIEVADLNQDPAGFFGRMIERFVKVLCARGPNIQPSGPFCLQQPGAWRSDQPFIAARNCSPLRTGSSPL